MNRFSVTLFVATVVMGCGGGSKGAGAGRAPGGVTATTVKGTVSVSGGAPIGGATVTAGAGSATTGADGSFSVPADGSAARIVVNVSADGYAPQVAVVLSKSGVTTYRLPVRMVKLTETTIDPATGGQLTVTSMGTSVQIVVPAGGIVGTAPVKLRGAGLDLDTAPGTLDSPSGSLISRGMVYIDAVDGAGNARR